MTDNIATKIEQLGSAFNTATTDLSERISGLEKSFARMDGHANDNFATGESLATALVNTPAFKELNGGANRGRAYVESAAITSGNTTVGTGRSQGTSLVPADRRPGIVTPAQRVLTVRDLIAPGKTTAGSIEFVQETLASPTTRHLSPRLRRSPTRTSPSTSRLHRFGPLRTSSNSPSRCLMTSSGWSPIWICAAQPA